MSIISQALNLLAQGSQDRITADLKQSRKDLNIARVVDFDSTIGQHVAQLPDGSVRYFRHIGANALPIGFSVSVTTPRLSVIGWSNSKPIL